MIDRNHRLSVTRQARMLGISRASVYYIPRRVSEADLKLMRAMDELHLEYPFAGSRMLRDMLCQDGFDVGRKHVATLMRRMGIEALCTLHAERRGPGEHQRQAAAPQQAGQGVDTSIVEGPSAGVVEGCVFLRKPVSVQSDGGPEARRHRSEHQSALGVFRKRPPHTFSLQKLDLDYYTITDSVIYICDDH